MASLKKNIAANFASSLWTGIVALAFLPLYIRYMGIEPFGLVGFYLTLQGVLAILDAGMATTLNREFARLSASDATEPMRRLLRTFELIYWGVAVSAGAMVMLLARWIASEWVKPEKLSIEAVQQAVLLMGLSFVVQWPLSLYSGGMMGLQKQVSLSAINAVAGTLRGGGVVLVLWLVSSTIQAFFTWQIVIALLHTLTVAIALWRGIGGTAGAVFDRVLLRATWRFAAGITIMTALASALTQLDKVILSRILSLEAFGYYAFAGTVASSLYRVIAPTASATFPRFSQLVGAGDEITLASLYHATAQIMSVIVLPAAVFIAFFSRETLLLWTRDAVTARNTHAVLSILIVGTAMNGILNIPYLLQLSYGWTRMVVTTNAIAVVVLVPLVYVLTLRFGVSGAAFGWLAYNVTAALVVPAVMHTRILRGEFARWLLRDVGAPLLAATVIAAAARALLPNPGDDLASLVIHLAPVAFAIQLAAVLTVPPVRRRLFNAMRDARIASS
jgi:O-antigen/teichoic acid export membrane protein